MAREQMFAYPEETSLTACSHYSMQWALWWHGSISREGLDRIGLPIKYNLKMAVISLGSDELVEDDKSGTAGYKCSRKSMRYETIDFTSFSAL